MLFLLAIAWARSSHYNASWPLPKLNQTISSHAQAPLRSECNHGSLFWFQSGADKRA